MKKENITQQHIEFGCRVKEYRMKRKMSQEELAFKVGFKGRASISKIEKGEISCNQVVLNKLANALDVAPEILLKGEDSRRFDFYGTISEYSIEEELLIELYRSMDAVEKQRILQYIKASRKDNGSNTKIS